MKQINYFHKGLVLDLDVSKIDNASCVLPTENIRFVNRDGDGLIATPVNGNDYDLANKIGFKLTDGFIPITSAIYNGIAYIISYNPTSLCGELGCYPSPKSLDASTPSNVTSNDFERVYRTLKNFTELVNPFNQETTVTRLPFRTSLFNIDLDNPIDLSVRRDYDDSVNIYITDGKNFNRVINSGFKQDGSITNRLYWNGSFPYIVSHTPLVNAIPDFDDIIVRKGGRLKSGNYFLFIRLVTENYNRTKFIGESNAISIFEGDSSDYDAVQGIRGSIGDTGKENISDKQIDVTINNIDTSYKYFEIVMVRYYSDEGTIPIYECKLIDKYYNISGSSGSNTVDITICINGYETLIDFSESDVISPTIRELTCKSHTQIFNRWLGSNWKNYLKHSDYLKNYASNISPYYDDSKQIDKTIGYKNYENIKDYTGYFRSEVIPFGIVFILKGGVESDVYPTKGYDDIDCTYQNVNDKGLYRFPSVDISQLTSGTNLKIMGIKFDNSNAETYRNSSQELIDYFNDNILGFYYVRGPRYENLKYQGLLMYGCRSYRAKSGGNNIGDYEGIVEQYNEGAIGDIEIGLMPYGTSKYVYDIVLDTFDDVSSTGSEDAVGVMKRLDTNIWASWIGQNHAKYTEYAARSDIWGANRGKQETGQDSGGNWGQDVNAIDIDSIMPIYKGIFPSGYILYKDDDDRIVFRNYCSRAYYIEKYYGLISPDYVFDEVSLAPKGAIIKKIASYSFTENIVPRGSQIDLNYNIYDTYPWWYLTSINSITYSDNAIIEDAKFNDINKYTKIEDSKGTFVSEYTDAGFSDANFNTVASCMWYWQKYGGRYQGASNRSMSTCKYIGVQLDSHEANLNLSLVNIFDIEPTTSQDITTFVDIKNTQYSKISKLIDISAVPSTTNTYYKGDCFLQRTYIKQMSYRGTTMISDGDNIAGSQKDTRESNDTQLLINFGHGMIIELITENKINTELRFEIDKRTFYPKCNSLKSFAVYNPDTQEKTESFAQNKGYNITTSFKTYNLYDQYKPSDINEYITRIRYSDEYSNGSYVDSFRNIQEMNYQDYDSQYGPIIAIRALYNNLISIQYESINQHFANQRQANIDTTEGQITVGVGEMLSKQYNRISGNGGQHFYGILLSEFGLWVIDWRKRVIQIIGSLEEGLGVIKLNEQKSLNKWVYGLFENYEKQTDKVNNLPDTPLKQLGFRLGYDCKYKDVYFTFLNEADNTTETMVYNEDLQSFIGNSSAKSPYYLTINNDFYSSYMDSAIEMDKIYLHDRINKILVFYGTQEHAKLSMIVNGINDKSTSLPKRYSHIEIETNDEEFYSIQYQTKDQIGLHDSFSNTDTRFWLQPIYREGKYLLPIMAQTTSATQFYNTSLEFMKDSYIRGEWMKITLDYNKNSSTFIKNVITDYEISFL